MKSEEADQIIHSDCAHYRGAAPCTFHKQDGRPCPGCPDYSPLKSKVLVVKLDAMGDVLRTTAILPALAAKYPGAQITWVTRERSRALLEGIPLIHRVLAVEGNYLEALLAEQFDLGIGLDADALSGPNSLAGQVHGKTGIHRRSFWTGEPASPEARTWWLMGVNDHTKQANRRSYQELMYEICRLPGPISRPLLPAKLINEEWIGQRRADWNLGRERKVIGLNTGGGGRWQCKKWTVAGYVELIRRLRRRAPDAALFLYGGPEEVEINAAILASCANDARDLGCSNTISEFVSLVSFADVFFTPDSLGFHISVALQKRTVVLVGPTSPWELDVYGLGEVLVADDTCAACYRSRCERRPTCMETLDPTVIEAAILRQWNLVK